MSEFETIKLTNYLPNSDLVHIKVDGKISLISRETALAIIALELGIKIQTMED